MLSSRKAFESRSLHGSTTETILFNQTRTRHHPPSSLSLIHREFSWGSRHKNNTIRAGKVYKGFGTQESAGKDMTRKQLYRSTLWGNHHLCRYLPRYAPIQEWRFSSSWGKKPEAPSSSRSKAEANEEEGWYTRWEKQKSRQYDDFMKNVEHDPYTVLFGKSWRSFSGEDTEPKAARTPPPSPKETSVPRDERAPENWPSKSKSSKISENKDMYGKDSKSETTPIQENAQEYEIDPITNRKVLKTAASPVFKVEHVHPQIKDPQRAFEIFSESRNMVSPTPLDSRRIIVDKAWALSSSYPLNKDTSHPEPDEGSGWLAQEGFSKTREAQAETKPTLQTRDAKSDSTVIKIESALDRHLSSRGTAGKNDRPQLRYKPEENKAEDIDLLRPSDVRASAGLRGNAPKETDLEKQARRQKLEKDYESCSVDREIQSAGEAERNKRVQERAVWPVEKSPEPELRFGSWLKGTLPDREIRDKEASKGTPKSWVNELSDARDFDPIPVDQTSYSTLGSNNKLASELSNAVSYEAQSKAIDKASRLKAQIVPFKAKLDAMKADYDALRQQWLQEIRRLKEKAAQKEEEMKAQRVAKRAREIHEEEIKTQKVAMEAMEMRSSGVSSHTAKNASAKGIGNNDGEKLAPRRLQSFLQGEGDMASNVHEFAGRDRWYKRKAPHAIDAKDVELERKLQKLAADKALIREVRGIYEDTYGTIDTNHRQPQVLSVPLTKPSDRPIASSSGLHAQLPSRAESMTEPPRGLDQSQSPEALEIIQKLFGQLREAQSIIQDYRSQPKQALDPSDQNTNTSVLNIALNKSILQILRTSVKLAGVSPGGMLAQGSVEAIAAANSTKPTINRPLSTTAPKPTNLEARKPLKLNTYCVLAYDSATQEVKSAEATMLAPFSKEESLLPLDALNRLHNPGIFLPLVMSLRKKGFQPISGTSNILVFKREVIPGNLMTVEEFKKHHQASLDKDKAEQHKAKESQKQAIEKTDKEQQKLEENREIPMDGIKSEKQPFEESSSASPRHTSGDKVHRQETVFSGSRHGKWVDSSVKHKRSKRAADRGDKFTRHVLMGGAFTAACCYCVGVASEMMRNW